MSLVNEALKKARTAQSAGTDAPEMRPAENDGRTRGGSIFTLQFVIGVVLILACVLLWAWYQSGQVIVVRGNSNSSAAFVAPAPQASAPTPTVAPVVAPAATTTTVAPTVESTPAATTVAPAPDAAVRADAGTANPLTPVAASKPAGPVYKLEGIFYTPKRPSAVINGDLVYVGSPVDDGRVVAIDNESVTVVTSEGQTNLLVLTR
jgi:hypothetical protein